MTLWILGFLSCRRESFSFQQQMVSFDLLVIGDDIDLGIPIALI